MPVPLRVLPALKPDPPVHCVECGRCCTYVAVGINAPRTLRFATDVLWYLYHENVSVFVDWEGQWYVKSDTRCKNLTAHGLCGIYERRPGICKDFDWQECENHMTPEEGPPDKVLWETPDAFLAWFQKQRPKAFRRYRAFMKKKHRKAEKPELLRIGSAGA